MASSEVQLQISNKYLDYACQFVSYIEIVSNTSIALSWSRNKKLTLFLKLNFVFRSIWCCCKWVGLEGPQGIKQTYLSWTGVIGEHGGGEELELHSVSYNMLEYVLIASTKMTAQS